MRRRQVFLPATVFLRPLLLDLLLPAVCRRAIRDLRYLAGGRPEVDATAHCWVALRLAATGCAFGEEVPLVLRHTIDGLFVATGNLLADCLGSLRGNAVVFLIARFLRRFAMVAQLAIVTDPPVGSLRLRIGVGAEPRAAQSPGLVHGEFRAVCEMARRLPLVAQFPMVENVVSTVSLGNRTANLLNFLSNVLRCDSQALLRFHLVFVARSV